MQFTFYQNVSFPYIFRAKRSEFEQGALGITEKKKEKKKNRLQKQ